MARPVRVDPRTGQAPIGRSDFAEQIEAGNKGLKPPPGAASGIIIEPGAAQKPEDIFVYQPPVDPSFSSDSRDQYRQVRIWAKEAYGFGSVADTDARTKWAADKYNTQYGRYPTATELWTYQPYQDSLALYASGGSFMDPFFGMRGEDGGVNWVYNNGLEWVSATEGQLLEETGAFGYGKLQVHEDPWAVAASFAPVTTGGTGSRGRSGAVGRQEQVFDRDKLAAEVTNRWRGLLLEEPEDATLNKTVNDYIAQANAFWMKEAGSLDFDTFVVNRIRAQDRYGFLYEKKPEFQSEAEYMAQYRNVTAATGMNDRFTLRETEAGAHSGAGLAGFSERLGRTAEMRSANAGTYSQRFAQGMAQSGLGRT